MLKELGFGGEPDLEPLPDEIATAVIEAIGALMEARERDEQ